MIAGARQRVNSQVRGTDPILASMTHGRPLVEVIRSIIQRTYGLTQIIGEVGPYIVGDQGFRKLYGGSPDPSGEAGARLLVRHSGDHVRAVVYYPDALVRHLERFNPIHGLGDVNITAFAVLVEEIDHLLTLASRAVEGRGVTLLELEHHANVTKYLTVLHFLGKQTGRLKVDEGLKHWARHHLFERYSGEDGAEESRYREAARLAWRYLKRLEALPVERRRAEIRSFHWRPFTENLHQAGLN
jgi:hypothetical protein